MSPAQPRVVEVVFDGPPGPEGGRFVEVEDGQGRSICFGTWAQRTDGCWVLRFEIPVTQDVVRDVLA